ncbi:MAG: hypothetical protein ABSG90_12330 [Dehalococcoidia bacterium]|jgi:hypothetical protein
MAKLLRDVLEENTPSMNKFYNDLLSQGGGLVAARQDKEEKPIAEATSEVERWLSIEDRGWLKYGNPTNNSLDLIPSLRQYFVYRSRRYFALDPLAKHGVRMWTDYAFGSGISFQPKNDSYKETLNDFWYSQKNRPILSAQGQRKASDKLLVDGEIFFAFFISSDGKVTVRWIDPLEISEIITDPEDVYAQKYFKRMWQDQQGKPHETYYRSTDNEDGEPYPDSQGKEISSKTPGYGDALVLHLPFTGLGQRGMPLLLPCLDWIDEYRRFLASRIAITRALARFAWKAKVMGGQASIDAVKAKIDGKYPQAGSTWTENQGINLESMKQETGANSAEIDGRMIKLMICCAFGISEQYFADIKTGNLATAKTVELPLLKQFSSYQQLWSNTYESIFSIVLKNNGVKDATRDIITFDFPPVSPEDIQEAVTAITGIMQAFPKLDDSDEVLKQGLMNLGFVDVDFIMSELKKAIAAKPPQSPPVPPAGPIPPGKEAPTPEQAAIQSLQALKASIQAIYEAKNVVQ